MENIGICCFAACYVIAAVLELFRLRTRGVTRIRTTLELCALGTGLFAHSAFLYFRTREVGRVPLCTAQDWLLVLAWILVCLTITVVSTHRNRNFGLWLFPFVLGTVGLAAFLPESVPFATTQGPRAWGMIHGLSMLLASVSIFCGFLSGSMYLRQAWRLKHPHLAARHGRFAFTLPSLEWLHYANRHSMKLATTMLGLGVLSGAVLNRSAGAPLHDGLVLGTIALLAWFVISLLVGFIWRRANSGIQIAYRTILSFFALCLLLGLVLFTEHRASLGDNPENLPAQTESGGRP